jgi:ABC-type Fe3+ transport system permease subunit
MLGKRLREVIKRLNLISVSVPICVLAISIFMPLRPFIRQGLIGVMLVWFGLEAMTGFTFWQ